MNTVKLGNTGRQVPEIVVGCMRLGELSREEMNHYLHTAVENGAYYFDHADIYGAGKSEEIFGRQ